MSKNKFTESFGSKGYYIALILCAVAIGVSGYLYYRNESKNDKVDSGQSVLSTDPAPGDVQAAATQPLNTPTQPSSPTDTTLATQPAKKPGKIRQPVSGQTVSDYAMDALSYNQTTRDWRTHNGIDIAAETGTEVCAAADGTVYTVYEDETMGTTVVIRHEGGYVTTYSSLDAKTGVKTGDTVTAGQVIGCVGNSALLETALGEHIHFSVTCNGEYVDPAEFLTAE